MIGKLFRVSDPSLDSVGYPDIGLPLALFCVCAMQAPCYSMEC